VSAAGLRRRLAALEARSSPHVTLEELLGRLQRGDLGDDDPEFERRYLASPISRVLADLAKRRADEEPGGAA
jgi:hypothetical protein